MVGSILSYVGMTLTIFLLNIIPAFAPPSWLLLSIYKINNPGQNIFIIALLGVLGSVAGRSVMYAYSSILGNHLPKKYSHNVGHFRVFMEKRKLGLFMTSFLFSLGPLPSNFLFIASGISKTKPMPVFAGFAIGRLISYLAIVYASFAVADIIQSFGFNVKILADLLGIAASLSIIFIDWKKVLGKEK
jgi:membrane protein YqaA with SNARE-associated domain